MFMPYIYDSMIDNDETWFVTKNGAAMLISDCQLIDC
jgi:hypothetical protein